MGRKDHRKGVEEVERTRAEMNLTTYECTMVIRGQSKVNEAILTYLNGTLPSNPIFDFESEIEE